MQCDAVVGRESGRDCPAVDEALKRRPPLASRRSGGRPTPTASRATQWRQRTWNRVGHAPVEPRDHSGADAADHGTATVRGAQDGLESPFAPEGQQGAGVAAADEYRVLTVDERFEVGGRWLEQRQVRCATVKLSSSPRRICSGTDSASPLAVPTKRTRGRGLPVCSTKWRSSARCLSIEKPPPPSRMSCRMTRAPRYVCTGVGTCPSAAVFGAARDRRQNAPQQRGRRRRASGDLDVDGNHVRDASKARIAFAEDAAGAAAVADGDDELRIGRCIVRALERDRHVLRHGTRDEQQVGVPRDSRRSGCRVPRGCSTDSRARGSRARSRCTIQRRHAGSSARVRACAGPSRSRATATDRPQAGRGTAR